MDEKAKARWEKLRSLRITAGSAAFGFTEKLIHETGWSHDHAVRAIEEYRRFLLLAAEAGHPVSPSPDVDLVWHLHLLYSRSYWEDLCPNILGFPFHHEPADGTSNDRVKLDDWYARTLASYRRIFDQDPPDDLWPARAAAARLQRVDLSRAVVLPRGLWIMSILLVILLAVALAGVAALLAVQSPGR